MLLIYKCDMGSLRALLFYSIFKISIAENMLNMLFVISFTEFFFNDICLIVESIIQRVSYLDCRNFKYYVSKVHLQNLLSRHNNRTSWADINILYENKVKIFPALINKIKIVFRSIITVSTLCKSSRST